MFSKTKKIQNSQFSLVFYTLLTFIFLKVTIYQANLSTFFNSFTVSFLNPWFSLFNSYNSENISSGRFDT